MTVPTMRAAIATALMLATTILPATAFAADGALTGFDVALASSPRAGTPVLVTVTAKADAETKTDYQGLVVLTTSDPKVAPASYLYKAQDQGVHQFVLTFHAAGLQTVTAMEPTAQGAGSTTVAPGPLDHLRLVDAADADLRLPMQRNVGDTIQIFAKGSDADGNDLGPVTVDWAVNGAVGTVSPSRGASTIFTATTPGVGTATAAWGAVRAQTPHIVVLPGSGSPVASIAIRDAPRGQGNPVGSQDVSADERRTLFAAGYDANGQYVADVDVAWTVTPEDAPCGTVTVVTPSSAVFDAQHTGTVGCRVHAAMAGGPSADTGVLTVTPGVAIDLAIRAGSSTGPLVQGPAAALATSDIITLHAVLQDADGNVAGPAPADTAWRVLHDCGALDATTGASVRFEATQLSAADAACRVRAAVTDADAPVEPDQDGAQSFGTAAAFTGVLTVTGAPPTSILIRTGPNGAGVALTSLGLTADDAAVPLYAAGYDAAGHFVGDQAGATWTLSDASKATVAPAGDHVDFTALHPPGVTLTATVGAQQAQASISIAPGAPAALLVRDEAAQPVSAIALDGGDDALLFASATDARGNDVGSVAASWSVDGACGSVSDEQGDTTTFTAGYVARSPCSVRASLGALADAIVAVTVTPPPLASIKIRDAPDGAGQPVADITQASGDERTLYAAGYDAADHFIGDQDATWTLSSPDLGTVDIDGDAATFEAALVGSGTLEATVGSIAVSATVTVLHGPLDHLSIEDAPADAGEPVDAAQMQVDEQRIFYAVGRDAAGNFVADAPVAWTLEGAIGTIDPPQGPATTLTALRVGAASLVATDTAGRSAQVEVAVAGLVDHITIQTAGDGTGVNDPGHVMLPGDKVTLHAVGLDANGLYAGPVVVDWSVGNGLVGLPLGSFSSARGSSTVLTAQKAGSGRVFADDDGGNSASTGLFQVKPGLHHHFAFSTLAITSLLVCEPSALALPSSAQAGTTMTLTVAACDDHDNLQPNYAGQMQLTSTDTQAVIQPATMRYAPTEGGVKTGSVTLRTSGTQSVTAMDTTTKNSGTMQMGVTPAAHASFTVSGVPTFVVAGVSLTATIWARDSFGNVVPSYAGTASVTTTSGTVSPAMLAFTNGQGMVTVTPTTAGGSKVLSATDGAITGTRSFTVLVSSRASVRIVDGSTSTIAVDAKTFTADDLDFQVWAAAFDAYGNRIGLATDVTWSLVGDDIGDLTATSGSTVHFAPTTPGSGHLRVVDAEGRTDDTGTFTVSPGAVDHLTFVPSTTAPVAGVPFTALVTLYDAQGNVKTDATSVVALTASSGATTVPLPAAHTFTAGDAGQFTFSGIVLTKSGSRTLTASATGGPSSPAATLTVQPAAAAALLLSCTSCTFTAGTAGSVVVKGVDAFQNTVTAYSTSTLTASGLTASPSGTPGTCATSSPTFSSGQATISCTLYDARQATSLGFSDGTLVSTAPLAIAVTPGPAASFALALDGQTFQTSTGTVSGTPNLHTAGEAKPLALRALDAWRNVATTYTGDHYVVFDGPLAFDNVTRPTATSSAGVAVPFGADTTLTFTAGLANTALTLYRAGPGQQIGALEHVRAAAAPTTTFPRSASDAVAVAPGHGAAGVGILRCAPPADPATQNARDCILASGLNLTQEGYSVTARTTIRFYAAAFDAWNNTMRSEDAPWAADADDGPAWRSHGTASTATLGFSSPSSSEGADRYVAFRWTAAGDDVLMVTYGQLRPSALHVHVQASGG